MKDLVSEAVKVLKGSTVVEAFGNHPEFKSLKDWKAFAVQKGYKVKELTHPSGDGTHWVAKDKEGNNRGSFDPETNKGTISF